MGQQNFFLYLLNLLMDVLRPGLIIEPIGVHHEVVLPFLELLQQLNQLQWLFDLVNTAAVLVGRPHLLLITLQKVEMVKSYRLIRVYIGHDLPQAA